MKQQNTLQPKLRFPEFSEDWKDNSFKDIFTFSTGKNIKQKEASPEFRIPCVRYGELYYMYKEVITKTINYTNLDESDLKFSEGDEIILPSAGEDPMDIGSASALTVKNVAIGRTINILKPKVKDVYSSIFASYYINQKLKVKISTLAKGVSISNVYNTDLQTLFLKLPSLPEQQKIADYLTIIDKKIELLEEKKTELSRYKKAMMQKLFAQEIRFKDENGNDYPEWEEKRLGEICKKSSSSLSANQIEDNYGQYKLYGAIGLMKSVDFYQEEKPYISIVKDGAGVGRVLLCDSYSSVLGTLDKISTVSSNNLVFVYYYLLQMNFTKYITGSTIPHIYFKDYSKLRLNVPSLPEQQKIADFLSAIDENINKVEEQIKETQNFKKAMLQQLFV